MKKIFYIEDNKIVAELLKYQLECEFQCIVICFSSAQDLLAHLDQKPDVIILDYFFDHTDSENGLSLLKKIKLVDKTLPVIIFSGQYNMNLAVNLIRAGAVDYIDKNQDDFLEDMINGVHNILQYSEAKKQLTRTQENIRLDRKQILTFGFLALILLFSLLII